MRCGAKPTNGRTCGDVRRAAARRFTIIAPPTMEAAWSGALVGCGYVLGSQRHSLPGRDDDQNDRRRGGQDER
jgi:hypothetical protein